METTDIQGGCLCGAIRYRLTCVPSSSSVCHCPDCRHACGAQAVAWITLPYENFIILQGELTAFYSSDHAVRTFCGKCGTSLTFHDDKRKHEIDVTTGSLDDPNPYPPTEQVFFEHRILWVEL
jgi:hypothetical protein